MKAGLIALAAGSLVGSALANHHAAMHQKKAEYYDPATSSSSVKSSSSSAYYYDPPSSSSTKSSSSSSVNYYYDPATSSSYKSSSTSCSESSKHSSSTKSKYSKSWTSSFPVAPVKPVSTCKVSTTTTTVVVYLEDYTTPVKPVIPSTTSYTTVKPTWVAPTPLVTIFKTPGVYALPTVTVHVNSTITVIAKKSATLTSGTNYYGGWSTTVNGSSTVKCPYVAKETNGNAVTEVISYTEFVCPTAGVYTPVAPTTTVVLTETVIVYAIPTSYAPGIYTAPAVTYTATETDEIYVCPYETLKTSTTTTTYTTSAVASVTYTWPATSSTPVAPVVPSVYSSSSSVYSPVWVAPSSSSSSAAPAKSSSAAPSVNGKKWAMTYTPYTDTGDCKTASEVDADIAIIAGKGFTTVRIYATDCSGLINVGASVKAHGLKIILGVFIKAAGISDASPQVAEIAAWGAAGNWGLVTMIVVGNEAIFNQYCSASDLAAFITSSKATWAASGYYGPVTTTEPVSTIQASGAALCDAIDVVAANIQSFFTSSCSSASAGTFVQGQLEIIGAVCPGKTAYNLESGWPSYGSSNGAAIASPADQAAAIADIVDKAGEVSVIFSYGNDPWKAPGGFGVEQFFGCSQLF